MPNIGGTMFDLFEVLFENWQNEIYKDGVFSLAMAGVKKKDIKVQVKGKFIRVNGRIYTVAGANDLKVDKITYIDGMLRIYMVGHDANWSDVKID